MYLDKMPYRLDTIQPIRNKTMEAIAWMKDYFDRYGDQMPDSNKVSYRIMQK